MIFFGDVMDRIYDVTTFISKKFILRRPGVAIFAGIIKIVTMFIKTIFKNSRKVKTRNYVSNWWSQKFHFLRILLDVLVGLTPFYLNKKYRKWTDIFWAILSGYYTNPNDNFENRCHSKIILGHVVFQLLFESKFSLQLPLLLNSSIRWQWILFNLIKVSNSIYITLDYYFINIYKMMFL